MLADAVYEILLRVPAKDLCRFRAVCRPWRSLLSDLHFIVAHATRHPGPLIIAGAGYDRIGRDHGILCDIMYLSGRVLKRVRSTVAENEWLEFTQRDLICTEKEDIRRCTRSFRLLNPADGAVYAGPGGRAEEHADLNSCAYTVGIAFGQVPSTGKYKVLHVLKKLTLILATVVRVLHARWRRPFSVESEGPPYRPS